MKHFTRTVAILVATLALSREAHGTCAVLQHARVSTASSSLDGLTADYVADRAASTSFEVEQAAAEVARAASEVDRAWLAFLPRISAKLEYARLSDLEQPSLPGVPVQIPVLLNQTSFTGALAVPISDYFWRIPAVHRAAQENERAAALQEEARRLEVRANAKLLYYAWTRAIMQTAVAEQTVEQVASHAADVRHAFEAGRASNADVLRLESELAASELVRDRACNLSELLEYRLRTAMHDPAERPYRIGEDVFAPPPSDVTTAFTALREEALAQRAELKALEAAIGAIEEDHSARFTGLLPRLSGSFQSTHANPNPRQFPPQDEFTSTWAAGVALSFSVNDALDTRAQLRGLDARKEQVLAQRGQLADRIADEVYSAEQALREAKLAFETAARQLRAAEESHRVRHALFQAGRATSVELLDAETELTRARLESVHARIDGHVARVKLDHALGRDARP